MKRLRISSKSERSEKKQFLQKPEKLVFIRLLVRENKILIRIDRYKNINISCFLFKHFLRKLDYCLSIIKLEILCDLKNKF